MARHLELDEQIVVALRRIAQAIDSHSRLLWKRHGLTAPQIGVLRELMAQGEMTPSQLSDALYLSQATMAGILARLEGKKYIRRQRDIKDRRSFLIRLTAAGSAAIQRAPPLLRDHFRSELRKLTQWEQTEMLAKLQRVAEMMQAPDVDELPFLFTEHMNGVARLPRRRAAARAATASGRIRSRTKSSG
jgi:DNA-binding MarR family transcriptional regulator